MLLTLAMVAAATLALPLQAQSVRWKALRKPVDPSHNVLVVLGDDLGIDTLQMYGLNPAAPSTPNLDQLASHGLRFENAWAAASCSPTRAMIQTGLHSCRTGIGGSVGTGSVSLTNSPNNLACLLGGVGYSTAAFGKWHLTAKTVAMATCTPLAWGGYDEFFGALWKQPQYCSWDMLRASNGIPCSATLLCAEVTTAMTPTYMTTVVGDEAASWISGQSGEWFGYFAPQAPFSIYHAPPSELHTQTLTGPTCSEGFDPVPQSYYAALQALDTKIGDLLVALGPNWQANTTIVFLGDNGSPMPVNDAIGYWPSGRGKETLFEAGVRVPFLVAGKAVHPSLRGKSSPLLVHAVDVYPTVLEIAGVSSPAETDGRSLLSILAGRSVSPVHEWLYAESFANTLLPPDPDERYWAMRDANYKLIHLADGSELFYDLATDLVEEFDLGPPLPVEPGYASYVMFKTNVPCP